MASLCVARAPTAAPRAAPRVRARGAARAARAPRAASMATETGVLYTSDDLEKDVAPPSDADAVIGAAGAEEEPDAAEEARAHSSPSRVDVAADRDDAVLHDAVTLERGASATSAPWVPFSPSGSVCFEVALDARVDGGLAAVGVSFAPGPDGRPRVAAVSETGAAFGEVNVGDVVLETSEVVMVETETNEPADSANASDPASASKKKRFVPRRRWRDSKDASFDECLAAMRSNFSFASGEHASVLSMRLCRDYVSENAIPMRGEADVAADVRWVDHDGSMEWNEEAIVSGKEWAARHAAGGF